MTDPDPFRAIPEDVVYEAAQGSLSERSIWLRAALAYTRRIPPQSAGGGPGNAKYAAQYADNLLEEFKRRFGRRPA